MFATLGRSQAEGTLQTVEQSNRLPSASHGNGHDACCECRQRKLKCSGEKTGCSRCRTQNKKCTYANSRASKREALQKSSSSSSAASTDSLATPKDISRTTTIPKEQLPQPPKDAVLCSPAAGSAMDISSIDDIDFTISDQEWPDQLMVDDFPTFDTPLSAFDSLSDESSNTTNTNITPHTMDVEFDALFALPDSPKPDQSFNSSMTRQSNSVAPQAPMMSATVERRPWPSRSHQHRPSSSTSRLSTQLPPPSPFHSESSSSMSSINSPRMTRRPNGPQRRTSTQPCNKSHNEYRCLSTALKLLESAHSCPKERAQVNELFRFLREIKRHIASLTALMLCPQCTKASTYLTLLSSIVSKLVLGLNETSQILTNRAIETSSSAGFDDYGVDTADEFAEMYANLTLSHLSDMRSLIAELGHKAAQEKWKVPYENLRLADSRLGTLEQEMQSFRPDKRVG